MDAILEEKQYHLNYFCVEAAVKYGVCEAVFLQSLAYWLEKNFKDKRNRHDGLVWTFNSVESMLKYFPYFTYNQLRRIINKLKTAGVIQISNYNSIAYDKTRWYSFTELGEKLLGICVHYEEEAEKNDITPSVSNDKSICENAQMEDENNTNDMLEITNRNAGNNKPIPIIETSIENTVIEKPIIDSSKKTAAASSGKPLSLSFLSDKRFSELYAEVERELFAEKEGSSMSNIFLEASSEDRYSVIIAELERRLAKEKEEYHKRNVSRLDKEHNNSEAMKIIEKYYGKGQQVDNLDALGRLYKADGWFYFDMYIAEAARLGIVDGKAICDFGMRQKEERETRRALRENGLC